MRVAKWLAAGSLVIVSGYHLYAPPAAARAPAEPARTTAPEPEISAVPSDADLPDVAVPWQNTPALQVIRGAWENARISEYKPVTRVVEEQGQYAFDCSGFVQWVLKQSHPVASRWAGSGLSHRPLARDYYARIAAIKPLAPRAGWERVTRVADIRPGDVIAWVKPKEIKSKNTGHVVFAVLPAVSLDGETYLVRVADSTRLWHADDTRNWRGEIPERQLPPGQASNDESPNDQGLGFGTISLVADPSGAPVEYGWVATQWRTFATQIAIGRPLK